MTPRPSLLLGLGLLCSLAQPARGQELPLSDDAQRELWDELAARLKKVKT